MLAEAALVPFLDVTAQKQLMEARDAYATMGLAARSIVNEGNSVRVFTWRGDWVNDTLALMLARTGLRAANEGLSIAVLGATADAVHDALLDIAEAPAPTAEEIATNVQNKYAGKWDGLLPDELIARNYASEQLDVQGAVSCANHLTAGNSPH